MDLPKYHIMVGKELIMNDNEHTPGPWEWFDDGADESGMFPGNNGLRSEATGEQVLSGNAVGAAGCGWVETWCDADASLIAAAPDLLKACENLIFRLDNPPEGCPMPSHSAAIEQIRDAIAKARRVEPPPAREG